MQVTKIDPADVIRRSPAACAKLQAERQAARAARKVAHWVRYRRLHHLSTALEHYVRQLKGADRARYQRK